MLFAGTLIYFFESPVQPDKFGSVGDGIWWAIITLSTVGYGDAVPMTTPGRILSVVTAFTGVMLFSLPAGILGAAFVEFTQNQRKKKEWLGFAMKRETFIFLPIESWSNMLLGIPKILSPELLKVLMEMGHGDELVIADGNFPSGSIAQATPTKILLRADGHNVPDLLDAILKFFPLDQYVEKPAGLMAVVPGDTIKPTIWNTYLEILKKHNKDFKDFEMIERFTFYERAKKAYAVLATGESALYANIILKKGVVKEWKKGLFTVFRYFDRLNFLQ